MHGSPRGHLNYYLLSKAGIFIAILFRKMTGILQPLYIVRNPSEYQPHIMVNMSSMSLSSATAEKTFQVTEISVSLEIMGDSSVGWWSEDHNKCLSLMYLPCPKVPSLLVKSSYSCPWPGS